MVNFKNVALVTGSTPPPETFRLVAQNVAIKGVIVDNANSTVTVLVYQGVSPVGSPVVILPGWSRGFPLDGTSAIYVGFSGIATGAGNIAIAWSDEPQAAFSSTILSAIANVNSFLPAGATYFQSTVAQTALAIGTPITLLMFTPPVVGANGTRYYLTKCYVTGMYEQQVDWVIAAIGAGGLPGGAPFGRGDADIDFLEGFLLGHATLSTVQLQLQAQTTIAVTPCNVNCDLQGYWI